MESSLAGERAYKSLLVAAGDSPNPRVESRKGLSLKAGEVLVAVEYSSLNYKDALAITGKGRILKSFPMVPGIDLAGVVLESKHGDYSVGSAVLATGTGLGEDRDGGYTTLASVPTESLIALPSSLSLRDAMAIGTAGFTAALARWRLELLGLKPDQGPVLVTGASGGVGQWAIALLAEGGYEVWALSAKKDQHPVLLKLGAHRVLLPEELPLGQRPLEKGIFAGAIDNLGGETLARILAHTKLWGSVAAIGLAAGADFHSSVMPFILRGVSLIGISSNNTPRDLRVELWQRLSGIWKPHQALAGGIELKEISLKDLPNAAAAMIDRKTHGRTIVNTRLD